MGFRVSSVDVPLQPTFFPQRPRPRRFVCLARPLIFRGKPSSIGPFHGRPWQLPSILSPRLFGHHFAFPGLRNTD